MRLLIRRLQKLEEQQEARASAMRAAGATFTLVWSGDDVRLDPSELADGEHAACDVVCERSAGVVLWGVVERASVDPDDLGLVRDEAGKVIGRVVRASADLIEVEYAEPVEAWLPVSVPRRS